MEKLNKLFFYFIIFPGIIISGIFLQTCASGPGASDNNSLQILSDTNAINTSLGQSNTLNKTSKGILQDSGIEEAVGITTEIPDTAPDDESKKYGQIKVYSLKGRKIREIKYPYASDWKKYTNYIKGYPVSNVITGDFDGDGEIEKAWFKIKPEDLEDCQDNNTKKSCRGTIHFSTKKIKPLLIDNCPIICFINEGDLNGDKKDEIGVLPGWFSSACRLYHVYSYNGTAWRLICEPINSTMNMREAGIDIIQKHPQDSGYVIIRESAMFIESKFPDIPFHDNRVGPFSCQESPVIEYKWKLK